MAARGASGTTVSESASMNIEQVSHVEHLRKLASSWVDSVSGNRRRYRSLLHPRVPAASCSLRTAPTLTLKPIPANAARTWLRAHLRPHQRRGLLMGFTIRSVRPLHRPGHPDLLGRLVRQIADALNVKPADLLDESRGCKTV